MNKSHIKVMLVMLFKYLNNLNITIITFNILILIGEILFFYKRLQNLYLKILLIIQNLSII